jgi:hypothetical protein
MENPRGLNFVPDPFERAQLAVCKLAVDRGLCGVLGEPVSRQARDLALNLQMESVVTGSPRPTSAASL